MLKYKEAILYAILILLGFIFLLTKIIPRVIDVVKIELQIKQKNEQMQNLVKEIQQMEEYEKLKKESVTKLKKIYAPKEQADTIENSFAIMLDDIINITKYNNVKVFSIQYTYNPSDDEFVSKSNNQYDACRIDFELISDYKNFVSMLIETIKYPYFLKINNFKIIPYQKDKKILLIQLRMTLYVERNPNTPVQITQVNADGTVVDTNATDSTSSATPAGNSAASPAPAPAAPAPATN